MKTLVKLPIVTSLLICTAIPMGYAIAATPKMETITVTYRSPEDYALYQYTTEMLSAFHQEIREDISIQARNSLMEMANDQQFRQVDLAQVEEEGVDIAAVWVPQQVIANE
ncbi:hypothetical protein [Shewanella acanthi]|uniref:hypothetical protein n=1 Tax=Shewanella acanthi TaxID=2864212 RepID=UPI001C660E81|nr:hypothetical protein [Shewanella acanthi]QYJ79656.1 hypothetical protein K0H61_04210 [Shewanella acanthi]